MKYDLLIKDGTVIDGTGKERFAADIGIVGDQIAAIGSLGTQAKELLDARDRIGRRVLSMPTLIWTRRSSGIRSAPARVCTASRAW